MRPGSTSIGGITSAPPSSWMRAIAVSVSATEKYTPQCGGTSAGIIGGFSIIPPTDRPPTFHSVYAPGPSPCVSAPQPNTAP